MSRTARILGTLLNGVGVVGLVALPELAPEAPLVGPVGLAAGALAGLAWMQLARRSSPAAVPAAAPATEVAPPEEPAPALPSEASLLANLSHEIRTPLNGVVSTAQLLADTPLDDEQRALVQTLETSSCNLLDLINDILDLSKAEAGEMVLERRAYAVESLASEVAKLFAAQAETKGLQVVVDIDPALPPSVMGDASRLRQVVSNLMSNAVKFTRSGDVCLRVDRQGDGVRFAVEDTGVGIPADAQDRIFQSYQQVDSATPRVFGGTGLGLAICQHLVGLMGGTIAVKSAPGKGSTFYFTVPAAVSEDPSPVSIPVARALVVDASAARRAMLQRLLEAGGCEVEVAGDGLEGLQLALHAAQFHTPFDVVLVDAALEGISGPVLARMFRREDELASVRILLMCSRAERPRGPELAELSLQPVDKPVLASALVRAMTHSSPAVTPVAPPVAPDPRKVGRRKRSLGTAAPMALAQAANQAAGDEGTGPRVLLVDDNGFNQMLIQMQLRKLDCRVRVAANGLAGVNAWSAEDFDLVLMDLQMPEMNGFEAAHEIRRREGEAGASPIPIVAVTADTSPRTRELVLEAGMNDMLTKPLDVTALRELVDSVRPRMEMGA